METILKKLNVGSNCSNNESDLIADIRKVCVQLNAAYSRFDNESNEDLLDSIIFEIEALRARYRYLLKMARKDNVRSDNIFPIWEAEVV